MNAQNNIPPSVIKAILKYIEELLIWLWREAKIKTLPIILLIFSFLTGIKFDSFFFNEKKFSEIEVLNSELDKKIGYVYELYASELTETKNRSAVTKREYELHYSLLVLLDTKYFKLKEIEDNYRYNEKELTKQVSMQRIYIEKLFIDNKIIFTK